MRALFSILFVSMISPGAVAHSLRAPSDLGAVYEAIGLQPGMTAKQVWERFGNVGGLTYWRMKGLSDTCADVDGTLGTQAVKGLTTVISDDIQIMPDTRESFNCNFIFTAGELTSLRCDGPVDFIKPVDWVREMVGPPDAHSTYDSTWYCTADKECALTITDTPGLSKPGMPTIPPKRRILFKRDSSGKMDYAWANAQKDACRKEQAHK